MVARVIASFAVDPEHGDAAQEYFQGAMPLIEKVGAKIIDQYEIDQSVVGSSPAKTVIIVEYPSVQAIHDVFRGDDYARLIPFRDRAFSFYNVSILTQ